MTKEELRVHCEKQVKMCEEWAKGNDREPSGKIYEEHKLILDLIKALEQQPSDDVMAIHTQGLDEGIRCAMCTNSMKSDTGCDGGCVVDEGMYKKVMDTINNQMFSQPTSDDCVSRAEVQEVVRNTIVKYIPVLIGRCEKIPLELAIAIRDMPPVTPTHGICKDCKHFHNVRKDFNTCDLWTIACTDNHYCADFEKRGNSDGSN